MTEHMCMTGWQRKHHARMLYMLVPNKHMWMSGLVSNHHARMFYMLVPNKHVWMSRLARNHHARMFYKSMPSEYMCMSGWTRKSHTRTFCKSMPKWLIFRDSQSSGHSPQEGKLVSIQGKGRSNSIKGKEILKMILRKKVIFKISTF